MSRRTGHGLHALLLTVPICTNLNWNQKTAIRLLKLFDDHTWRHTILLFTKADLLGSSGLEGYLKGAGLPMQALVEKCENRFHSLNNRNRENRKQVRELLAKIDQMVDENGGKTFQLLDSNREEEATGVHQSEAPRNTGQAEQLEEMSEHPAKLEEEHTEWKRPLNENNYTFGSLERGEECSVLFAEHNNEARHQLEMQDTPQESEVEEVKFTATDDSLSKSKNESCVDSVTRLYNKSCGEFGAEMSRNIEKLEMTQREFLVNQACEEQRNQSVDGCLSNDESEDIERHSEIEANATDEGLTMMGQPQNGMMKDNDLEDITSESKTDESGVLQTPDKADGNGSVGTKKETHRDTVLQHDKQMRKCAKNENRVHLSPTRDATELNIFRHVNNFQNGEFILVLTS